MTFEEWGATLRAEREKRHFSIDDVANELKINPRQIRALEDGDVGSLPHPAYVRGFIRSYASWLGMSQQEIHEGLENTSTPKPAPAPKAAEHPHDDLTLPEPELPGEKRGGHKGLLVFAILCAIAGGIYYAWDTGAFSDVVNRFMPSSKMGDNLQNADTYMAAKDQEAALKAGQQKQDQAEHTQPVTEQSSAERALPLPGNNHETVIAPIPGAGNPASQAAAGMEAAKTETPAQPVDQAEGEPQKAAAESQPREQTPGQHKLIITATEECWVHSNADKTDTRQFSLRKGDTFALAFSKSLELKLGNAGGVTLRYDGVDLPPAGTSGQVRTIKFPPPENQ